MASGLTFTLRSYSFRFSLNSEAASRLAGLHIYISSASYPAFGFEPSECCGLGGQAKRDGSPCLPLGIWVVQQTLHTRQDGRNIICRTPTVLQYIQTQLAVMINVRMEHFGYEADGRWFVGVCVGKCESEAEGAIFEGRVGCDDGIGGRVKQRGADENE